MLFCGFEIFKIILITSFILLLVIVIDTHFAPLKDLSKAFACMTNGNLKCSSLILKKIQGFRKHLRILKILKRMLDRINFKAINNI